MKVLVVYGGPNNGLKKELKKQDSLSTLTNLKHLSNENQFFVSSVKNMLKAQRIAAVDEIEIVSRHMCDLQDYLYEDDSLADLVKPPVDEV
jgi:mannitol-1-phosphate/altronate dehydrogenase